MQPETDEERWLAPTIRACEKQTSKGGAVSRSLEVINAGPAVWLIDGVPGWNADSLDTDDPAVTLFRYATRGTYKGLALEPAQQALFPYSYDQLHLAPDAALQAEWETVSRLTAAAEERSRRAALDRASPTGKAVIKCALAGYDAGQNLPSFDSNTTPRDVLNTIYQQTASIRSCSEAIDEASAEEVAAGSGAAIEVTDLADRAVGNDAQVERSGVTLIAAKIEDNLGKLLQFIPK